MILQVKGHGQRNKIPVSQHVTGGVLCRRNLPTSAFFHQENLALQYLVCVLGSRTKQSIGEDRKNEISIGADYSLYAFNHHPGVIYKAKRRGRIDTKSKNPGSWERTARGRSAVPNATSASSPCAPALLRPHLLLAEQSSSPPAHPPPGSERNRKLLGEPAEGVAGSMSQQSRSDKIRTDPGLYNDGVD